MKHLLSTEKHRKTSLWFLTDTGLELSGKLQAWQEGREVAFKRNKTVFKSFNDNNTILLISIQPYLFCHALTHTNIK